MGISVKQAYVFLSGQLFRSAGIYLISSFFNALIPFLLLPVLTRYLTPSDYGLVSMFMVLVSLIGPFTGLAVHGAVYKQYFELSRVELKVYVANAIGILICSSCCVIIIFILFPKYLSSITALPESWLIAAVVVSMMSFIVSIYTALLQVDVKPVAYGLFLNLKTISNLFFSLVLVIILGLNWQGRTLGILLNSLLFGIIALVLLYKQDWLKFQFNKDYMKNALWFGIPMIPTTLKGAIIAITDKVFITNMVGIDQTGLYTVAFQLSMAIALLVTSFNNAYVPWLFKKLKENSDNINRGIVKLTYAYFLTIIIIALLWVLISQWLLTFFVGHEFIGARPFILWLSIGFAFSGMHTMVVNYIYYTHKTAVYGFISIVSFAVNITLNYFLISIYGTLGAAAATCITYLITFLMTWWLTSKIYKMPWLLFRRHREKT